MQSPPGATAHADPPASLLRGRPCHFSASVRRPEWSPKAGSFCVTSPHSRDLTKNKLDGALLSARSHDLLAQPASRLSSEDEPTPAPQLATPWAMILNVPMPALRKQGFLLAPFPKPSVLVRILPPWHRLLRAGMCLLFVGVLGM